MDFFYPSYLSVGESDFYAMRMTGRWRQDLLDNAPGQFPGSLVFFKYDIDCYSWSNITPVSSIHRHFSMNIEVHATPV